MTPVPVLLFLAGILILYFGAEWLVRGSSQLALSFGISPLIVGLTVVAMGTSAPELVAGLQAQLVQHAGSIVLGNVVGSNIYNIGLILGLAALIGPLEVHSSIVKREMPFAIFASALMVLMMLGGVIHRWEGGILVLLFAAYIYFQIRLVRTGRKADSLAQELSEELTPPGRTNRFWLGFLILGGISALVVGAKLLIDNAVIIAEAAGISQRVIGLTMVAIGTSLPELATTLVAAVKKERDIAVGNVVGSNLFNILLILGGVAVIRPISFDLTMVRRDGPFMLAIIVLTMLMILRKGKLTRWNGALLLILSCVYSYFLF